jgi:hypothetical protein
MPVILDPGEAEIGSLWYKTGPCKGSRPYLNNKLKQKGLGP